MLVMNPVVFCRAVHCSYCSQLCSRSVPGRMLLNPTNVPGVPSLFARTRLCERGY